MLALSASLAHADPRSIEGVYRNPALGYAIELPSGVKGRAGDEAGPERGLRLSLPSGGEIRVFGEPNSLDWKMPEEGIGWATRRRLAAPVRRRCRGRASAGSRARRRALSAASA